MIPIDKKVKDEIGLTTLLKEVRPISSYGIAYFQQIRSFGNGQEIELKKCLTYTQSIIDYCVTHREVVSEIQRILMQLKPLHLTLKHCVNNTTLDVVELYELRRFLIKYAKIYGVLLRESLNSLFYLPSLEEALNLLDPKGERCPHFTIDSTYSPKMGDILDKKRALTTKGRTEPNTPEKANKEYLSILILEEQEDQRIRENLSKKLIPYITLIEEGTKQVGFMDFMIAKASFTLSRPCCQPRISTEFNIKDMYHPIVAEALETEKKSYQPIDIRLAPGATVITGANMGGKTITLKTVLLNMLLARMGFYVYGTEAQIPLCTHVMGVFKEGEKASKGLSSFGAEIMTINSFIKNSSNECFFIVLDEFARGTNPYEGQRLARALAIYFHRKKKGYCLMSTHFEEIAQDDMTHYQVKGLKGFDTLSTQKFNKDSPLTGIDIIQDYMDYRLEKVNNEKTIPCDGIRIARLLGIDQELLSLLDDEGGGCHGHTITK